MKAPARLEAALLGIGATALFVAVWQAAVVLTKTTIFPSPAAVFFGLGELVRKGLLWRYMLDSLLRVAAGYSMAIAIGIPIGILLGRSEALAATFNPVIQLLRPISPLAWIPLAIVLFGIGNLAPIFLVFLGSFFPIVVSTMSSARSVHGIFLRAGRNFGLTPMKILLKVVLPASLPGIVAGLRIALGIAWLVVVAAEMIAVDSGLGYLIIDSRNAGKRYDLVVGGMLLIGLFGLAFDLAISRARKLPSVRWGFRSDER